MNITVKEDNVRSTSLGLNVLIFILLFMMTEFAYAVDILSENLPPASIKKLCQGDELIARSVLHELELYPWESLTSWIINFGGYNLDEEPGNLQANKHFISDSVEAPYYIYVPSHYNPAKPLPLMVWLHGGVSRSDFIKEEDYFLEHPIVKIGEKENMLVLFPTGKSGSLWWDDVGIANIFWQIKEIKRTFNVDDDRVILGGFSDGASGAFHIAMLVPTTFVMFFSWSGHLAIGSRVGKMPVYVRNLKYSLIFATNGGRDRLYPAVRMAPMMKMVQDLGVDLFYTTYDTAGHNYGYLKNEFRYFKNRVKTIRRMPLKSEIFWEASDPRYGSVDWLEINEIDTTGERLKWHEEINYTLLDERTTIGFSHDPEWRGEGIKVASVSPDTSLPASKIGLRKGDRVIGFDRLPVTDVNELARIKAKKKSGDKFLLVVKRGKKILKFKAKFPPSVEYVAFVRNAVSGAVHATYDDNTFNIRASRVAELTIKIHPEMIDLNRPVKLVVNDSIMFNESIRPDTRYLLREYLKNRDKRLLWVNEIRLKL